MSLDRSSNIPEDSLLDEFSEDIPPAMVSPAIPAGRTSAECQPTGAEYGPMLSPISVSLTSELGMSPGVLSLAPEHPAIANSPGLPHPVAAPETPQPRLPRPSTTPELRWTAAGTIADNMSSINEIQIPVAPQETQTSVLYHQMRDRYQLGIPEKQFIGLCAYLCAILRLGFRTTTGQLDHFVCAYPAFAATLRDRQQAQIQAQSVSITAYHDWFIDHPTPSNPISCIINEARLRQVWAENPFRFLVTWHGLARIAERRQIDHDILV